MKDSIDAGARRGGFTLVELVVVMGVIVLLAGLTVSAGVAVVQQSERRQTAVALTQLQGAMREWELRSDRKLSWWNGQSDGPPEGFDVHVTTHYVYILSEVLTVIGRPAAVRDSLAAIDPELLHTFSASDAFPWLPEGSVDRQFIGSLTVLDAWGTPIYATHPGREWRPDDWELHYIDRDDDGTIRTPNEDEYGACRNREVVFVSAGPDRLFGLDQEFDDLSVPAAERDALRKAARGDNLYSGPVDFKSGAYGSN